MSTPHCVARIALAIVVCAAAANSRGLAQDPRGPVPTDVGIVEKSGIALTLLDVNVLDRQGRPMRDLNKEDFTVILNGRVRPIYSLDNLCVGTINDQELNVPKEGSAPDAVRENDDETGEARGQASTLAAAIQKSTQPAFIVLYMDFSQMQMSGKEALLDAAEHWVRESFRPGEQAQLVSYTSGKGLTTLANFTDNKGVLLAAITSARNDVALYDTFADEAETKILCCGSPSDAVNCPYPAPRPCGAWAWEATKHAVAGMRALQTHLIGLDTLPGRKALLYFQQSGSLFPSRAYGVGESGVGDIVSELDEVGAEAIESQTTIYAVQASGPRGGGATNLGANLADFTGGSYNRGGDADLEAFMQSAARETRCIYRIGLTRPPQSREVLRAKILVHNQPIDGRYRVRFLDAMDHWWRRAQAVLLSPERAADIRITTDIVPIVATAKRWRVKARVAVDLESVVTLRSETEQRGDWEVGALFANAQGKDVDEMLAVSRLHSDSEVQGPLFVVHERTIEDLLPGDYRLAAFARDRNINVFGGAETRLSIPDPKVRGVLGPLLMLSDRPHLGATLPLLRKRKSQRSERATATTGSVPMSRAAVKIGQPVSVVTFVCTGDDGPPNPSSLLRYVTRDQEALFRFEEVSPDKAGICYRLEDQIETGLLVGGGYTYHLSWSGAEEADRIQIEASFRIEGATTPVDRDGDR